MRSIPPPLKFFFVGFPFVSLFFFPWPVTLITAAASGLVFPPLAFFIGVLVDLLYLPGQTVPLGTLGGAVIALGTYIVRYVLKTRIM